MKQKKLIDLLKDMRYSEIWVLVLLSFQKMSIKHKKSLFPNISRDDNYHKSFFYATLNFHNESLLTVTGGRVSLFVSMYDEHTLELFHMYFAEFTASAEKTTIVSWDIYFQDPDFDFTLVTSYEESSSFSSFIFNLAYGRNTAFFRHMILLRCKWVTNGSF